MQDGKSVVAEVYPSIFRNGYPKGDKTADQQDGYRIEVSSNGFLRFPPHIARQSILSRLTGA
ncbi:MAG: hypothetical protein E2O75_06060 [Chloroflexi bacterium]|nr:MAG: hypothetical protein E2O75_06060 [Chloroflexota bacterium]